LPESTSDVPRLHESRKRRSRLTRRLLASAAALVVALLLGSVSRAWWLPLPAAWLQAGDVPRKADAIMVLSGSSFWRARKAAELFREHFAPRVLVTGGEVDEYFELLTGQRVLGAELTGRVLERLGVTPDALTFIDGVKNTHDEAVAFRQYARTHHIQTLVLVTSHLHSRRARWIFRRVLADVPIAVMAVEADQPDVSVNDWWQHPDSALVVLNEYLKFGYYVVHY
jgi:uncharacterized SAM-binding protein YcdF (DUF218 family)